MRGFLCSELDLLQECLEPWVPSAAVEERISPEHVDACVMALIRAIEPLHGRVSLLERTINLRNVDAGDVALLRCGFEILGNPQ